MPDTKTKLETRDRVVLRFAGDSGDGMQVTGQEFTNTAAHFGNDLATFPDYPAEIRAPRGTLAGVSGFQVHFSSDDIYTPGDELDVLVALNPAALKTNLADVRPGGIVVANASEFTKKNLAKADYEVSPLEDATLDGYQLFSVDITGLTLAALKDVDLPKKSLERAKNMYALGMTYFLYGRSLEHTVAWFERKFAAKPAIIQANTLALQAGYNYALTTEMFAARYEVPAAQLEPGVYRNISGNLATALGFVAAAKKCGQDLFLGSYPITPATEILHEMSRLKNFGIRTFQAEDEISAICSALGAAFGGAVAVTSTSGPGLALKTEAVGLGVMAELPLVIVDVQRAGPSTGLPTKTEQGDLLQAIHGRNGEAPLPVIAAATPSDCFECAFLAVQIAVRYMTPVIVLTDGSLANGSEPWRIPSEDDLPEIEISYRYEADGYKPYVRDPETLARPWAVPGTPGLEHVLGGLEAEFETGYVSYDPDNHERMVALRADKVRRTSQLIPPTRIDGPDKGDLLVVGWGATYGPIRCAVREAHRRGWKVSRLHLRWVHPLPPDLGDILGRFERVLVPELNRGQLAMVLQAEYLKPILHLGDLRGQPLKEREVLEEIARLLGHEEVL